MEKTRVPSDEIDLLQVFLKLVLIIKRNALLFLGFFVAGVIIGSVYAMVGTKIYESTMFASSDIIAESYTKEVGEILDDLITEKNYDLLSQKLNMSREEVEKITSIKIDGVKEKDINATEKDKEQFYYLIITVRVKDQDILSKLQTNLVSYFENNEYVRIRVQQRKKSFEEIIKKLDQEISSLETFRNDIYEGSFFEKNKGGVELDPSRINATIIDLTELRVGYKNRLEVANSIQVIEGFVIHSEPVTPRLGLSLAGGATLGLILVAIVISYKSIRSLIRTAEESSNAK